LLRSVRADFAPEIWRALGDPAAPVTFSVSEMWGALGVIAMNGSTVLIVDNRRAFFTALLVCGCGMGLLAAALLARRDDLVSQGQLMPGAAEALAAVAKLDQVVQTVLTGNGKPTAMLKLRAFGLDGFLDFDIGGYGSEAYPRGTLLRVARQRASDKHGVTFGERATVYVADSARDVDAARIGGASSLAVASGRASAAELRDAGADAVLPDLTDTTGLITLITRLTEPPGQT